jgi:hypothetical protein
MTFFHKVKIFPLLEESPPPNYSIFYNRIKACIVNWFESVNVTPSGQSRANTAHPHRFCALTLHDLVFVIPIYLFKICGTNETFAIVFHILNIPAFFLYNWINKYKVTLKKDYTQEQCLDYNLYGVFATKCDYC